MPVLWLKTNYPGVRFYEHPTRKHGVNKDRYFAIRAQVEGKRREEGLGWASEGWTATKAAQEVAALKKAHITGEGPRNLAEKRAMAEAQRQAEQEAQAQAEKAALSFGRFFLDTYFPLAKADKGWRSVAREDQVFRLWLAPVIGKLPLKDVAPFHLERIKKNMTDAGRAAQSIRYALAVARQVFNHARRVGLYHDVSPTTKVKKPAADNRRSRFLTHEEAEKLIEALAAGSLECRDMALLSLHCGLRAGEIFTLTWGDVDMERELLAIKDTKSGKNRVAFMTGEIRAIFEGMERGAPTDLVIPGRGGVPRVAMSATFDRVVTALGLNEGIMDNRQKVVFHSLRHTFASWLVEAGTDLYTVKTLMGHGSLAMTERYSHLAPDTMRRAVKGLEKHMQGLGKAKVIQLRG